MLQYIIINYNFSIMEAKMKRDLLKSIYADMESYGGKTVTVKVK